MTAICNGGSSAAKSNLQPIVGISSTAVESALILLGFPTIATVLGPIIAGISIDVTAFCGVDPPADPGLTPLDLIDVLDFGDPTVSIPAIFKFRQWFQHYYWCQLCECSNGVVPVCTPLSNPGTLSTNPSLPVSTSACFSGSDTDTITNPHGGVVVRNLTGKLLPIGSGATQTVNNVVVGSLVVNGVTFFPIPAGVTSADFHSQTVSIDPSASPNNNAHTAFVTGQNNSNTSSSLIANPPLQGSMDTHFIPVGFGGWDPTDTHWAVVRAMGGNASGSGDETVAITSSTGCTGNPLGQQCCPPDPAIDGLLHQILGLVTSLFQGQPTLNSFAQGTVHAGLTGNLDFALDPSTIAVKIELTTIPPGVGLKVSDPNVFFGAGFVTPISNEGNFASVRIETTPQVVNIPRLTLRLGVGLAPLVVATITELSPGP